jgi:hypothetical protein
VAPPSRVTSAASAARCSSAARTAAAATSAAAAARSRSSAAASSASDIWLWSDSICARSAAPPPLTSRTSLPKMPLYTSSADSILQMATRRSPNIIGLFCRAMPSHLSMASQSLYSFASEVSSRTRLVLS